MRRGWKPVAALAVLTAIAGCRHLPSPRAFPECPGRLVSTAAMGDDFRWRARVRVVADGERYDFQVVAEKRGDALLLVGLHPLGARLFGVTQRGSATTVEALPGAVLPVPPLNVLRDLHRIRFGSGERRDEAVVVRDPAPAADDGGERVTIRNPRCGVTSVYTTLPEGGAP